MLQPIVYTYMEMKTRNGGKHLVLLLYLPKFPPNVSEIILCLLYFPQCLKNFPQISLRQNFPPVMFLILGVVSEIGHPRCDWSKFFLARVGCQQSICIYIYTWYVIYLYIYISIYLSLISYHIISYRIISYRIISYHII